MTRTSREGHDRPLANGADGFVVYDARPKTSNSKREPEIWKMWTHLGVHAFKI